jgi:hypothetical protein
MEAELTSQEGPHFGRFLPIKAQYLADAISALGEISSLMRCHPNSYDRNSLEGHPDKHVQARIGELAELSSSIKAQLSATPRRGPGLKGMSQANDRCLADAADAVDGLQMNVEWHPETYRALRGYCHPEIEIPRRLSELAWLRRVFESASKGDNQNILRLEKIKDEALSERQPDEEYSCEGSGRLNAEWKAAEWSNESINQDDKGFTRSMQMAGKLFGNANRELGLLLRALGAYGNERGPCELNELIAKAKDTWEEYLAFFDQNRERWYELADEVFYALDEGREAGQELSEAEVQQLAELTKAKGRSAVAAELKVSPGTLLAWIEDWFSPGKRNLEKIRSYLQKDL